jgi:soluble lytic murein transglycosylase-like protein
VRSLVVICRVAVLLIALVGSGAAAWALEPSAEVDACLRAASAKHGISYALLRSIAEQESSFNPLAVRKPMAAGNLDRSTDYGLMQINSSWLNTLARYGVTGDSLFKPCVNADVGAWILADNFRRLGVTWDAVGAYNAMTPWKRVKYATGVYTKLVRYTKSNPAGAQQAAVAAGGHAASRLVASHEVQPPAEKQIASFEVLE